MKHDGMDMGEHQACICVFGRYSNHTFCDRIIWLRGIYSRPEKSVPDGHGRYYRIADRLRSRFIRQAV